MLNHGRRRIVTALGAGATVLAAPSIGRAQTKALTIVLTVPPGTSSDTLARLVGDRLKVKLNRNVVVESKSGAGGLVAVQYLRQFDADGSFIMMAPNSAVSLLPLFLSRPSFDMEKDLQPIVDCAMAPMAFTVHPATGVNSMAEYFDSVRKDPKRGSIGVPTPAGLSALVIYQLGKQLKLPLQSVPYRGGAPLLSDLLGNQIPASGSILPDYLEMHRAGKLKVLGHASEARSPLAPELPTFAEAGYPGFVAETFFGLYGKGGMPQALAADYAAIVTEALASTPVTEQLHKMGLVPRGGTPDEFMKKLQANRDRWAPVIKETGMKIDA